MSKKSIINHREHVAAFTSHRLTIIETTVMPWRFQSFCIFTLRQPPDSAFSTLAPASNCTRTLSQHRRPDSAAHAEPSKF